MSSVRLIRTLIILFICTISASAEQTKDDFRLRLDSIVVNDSHGRRTIYLEYDNSLRIAKLWKSDESVVRRYKYLPDGRLYKVVLYRENTPFRETCYSYNHNGQLVLECDTILNDRFTYNAPIVRNEYKYDERNRLLTKDNYTVRWEDQQVVHTRLSYMYKESGGLSEIQKYNNLHYDDNGGGSFTLGDTLTLIGVGKCDESGRVDTYEDYTRNEFTEFQYSSTDGVLESYNKTNRKDNSVVLAKNYCDDSGNQVAMYAIEMSDSLQLYSYHVMSVICHPTSRVAGFQEGINLIPSNDFSFEHVNNVNRNPPLSIRTSRYLNQESCTYDYYYTDL